MMMTNRLFQASALAVLLLATQREGCSTETVSGWSVHSKVTVAMGWHPLYQVKSDPEDENILIACAMKWSSRENAFRAVVFRSGDGGREWTLVAEDRHSPWVSEVSCAFGQNHYAYMISEASAVTDGQLNHYLGTTRLFVSEDSGKTWTETLQTGWADYSTSSVSRKTDNLYTFYQANAHRGRSESPHASVGLLVFPRNGRTVVGPYLVPEMENAGYEGVYPSHATALDDGSVVALFLGTRKDSGGKWIDVLGLERVGPTINRQIQMSTIASSEDFGSNTRIALEQYSLAYDCRQNKLTVVYVIEAGEKASLFLTTSVDGGRNWSKAVVANNEWGPETRFDSPSVAVGPKGILGMVWQDGRFTGAWFFSTFYGSILRHPALELSARQGDGSASNDSLVTVIRPPEENARPEIGVNVRSEWSRVGVAIGLIGTRRDMKAIWLSGDGSGNALEAGILLPHDGMEPRKEGASKKFPTFDGMQDVTKNVVLLYDGDQRFDRTKQTLSLSLRIVNRGSQPFESPCLLAVRDVSSAVGNARLIDAIETMDGSTWIRDLAGAITGDRIAAGATSNTIRFSFLISPGDRQVASGKEDFLNFNVSVYCSAKSQ
jgi:hypothetical protein